MIRAFGTDHQRKTINQTQFLLFENYVIRVMTPTNAFASSLQLSMAIKQYGPRQRTVWVSPARAFVAKARITLSRRTSPLPEGLTLTGHQFWIFGPAAEDNAAPDILNCPDPVPAYAIQGAGLATCRLEGGCETRRIIATSAPTAVILIRLAVGAVFLTEGIQKFL